MGWRRMRAAVIRRLDIMLNVGTAELVDNDECRWERQASVDVRRGKHNAGRMDRNTQHTANKTHRVEQRSCLVGLGFGRRRDGGIIFLLPSLYNAHGRGAEP